MKKTRLLSISFPSGGYGSVETNREKMVEYLEKAGAYRPDFVCFTEVARELGTPMDSEAWQGEPIPGPTTEALGCVARKYATHVPLLEVLQWKRHHFSQHSVKHSAARVEELPEEGINTQPTVFPQELTCKCLGSFNLAIHRPGP